MKSLFKKRPPFKPPGFSLVELLLVIVIMGIVTAISIPAFKTAHSNFAVENSAFGLFNAIEFAREQALAQNRTYRINFDVEKNHYRFSLESEDPEHEGYVRIGSRLGRTFKTARGVRISTENEHVDFLPDGYTQGFNIEISNSSRTFVISNPGMYAQTTIKDQK